MAKPQTDDARKLVRLMKFLGVNQRQLAKLLDVDASTITRAVNATEGRMPKSIRLGLQRIGFSDAYWVDRRRVATMVGGFPVPSPQKNDDVDPRGFLGTDEESVERRNEAFARAGLRPFTPQPAPAVAESTANRARENEADRWRMLLAKAAVELKVPNDQVVRLLSLSPPVDAGWDAEYWVQSFVKILQESGALRPS